MGAPPRDGPLCMAFMITCLGEVHVSVTGGGGKRNGNGYALLDLRGGKPNRGCLRVDSRGAGLTELTGAGAGL